MSEELEAATHLCSTVQEKITFDCTTFGVIDSRAHALSGRENEANIRSATARFLAFVQFSCSAN